MFSWTLTCHIFFTVTHLNWTLLEPSCSSLWPCCGKASLASSGSESTVVHDTSPGRWSATRWPIWSARRRTSTGSAGRTWPKNKSLATRQSGDYRTGLDSKRAISWSFLNTNTSLITWVTWESPRHGDGQRDETKMDFVTWQNEEKAICCSRTWTWSGTLTKSSQQMKMSTCCQPAAPTESGSLLFESCTCLIKTAWLWTVFLCH